MVESCEKTLQRVFAAFDVNLDAVFPVQYPAVELVFTCQPINERTEPNALHDAADADAERACHVLAAFDDAGPALPTDLNHSAVFDEDGNAPLPASQDLHSV